MQPQYKQLDKRTGDKRKMKIFADLMRDLFFLVSTLSLVVVMVMFVFVWQPIWIEGFKDFHTISQSINKLDETAQPASETIPLMLYEMTEMTDTMKSMQANMSLMQLNMLDMHDSMRTLEEITPNIKKMTRTIEHMDSTMSTQLGHIAYLLDRMEGKFSPDGMMPYNW